MDTFPTVQRCSDLQVSFVVEAMPFVVSRQLSSKSLIIFSLNGLPQCWGRSSTLLVSMWLDCPRHIVETLPEAQHHSSTDKNSQIYIKKNSPLPYTITIYESLHAGCPCCCVPGSCTVLFRLSSEFGLLILACGRAL